MQGRFPYLYKHGKGIRSVKRTSKSCRQQGSLPNLSVTRLSARAGEASDTELYSVDVTNTGRGDAQKVGVNLFVDGTAADSVSVDQVKAGETVTVRFTARSCKQGLRAEVDPADKINETNEDDNVMGSG